MDLERTALPGIGLQHTFTTTRGRRLAVIAHRNGRRDLVVYHRDDPDTAVETLTLTAEEANGLAELLGTTRIVERLAELHRQVEGLLSEQIPVAAGSPYDGRTLADTQARTRTGASIVAVVRDREVIASPRPDLVFRAGDVVVVVGTGEGTAAVDDIFASG
jgi:TrkA domain protein